ncbi:MAG: Na+/H+ antiporter subunit E [Candidatus Aerophobetes bacterium]|nr:Na+/H+ antiporter subunit E [Candidatus Aerophobetes bacterium]
MDVHQKWKIVRILLTTGYLMIGWLVFTCNLAPFSLFLGSLFSFIIALFTYDIFIEREEVARRALIPRLSPLLIYPFVLIFKIYLSSFKMIPAILTKEINPRIVHFRTRLKSEIARAILANSITLTPGTLTLNLSKDHLIVHWLNAKTTHSHYAAKLIKGHFETWLKRIWV